MKKKLKIYKIKAAEVGVYSALGSNSPGGVMKHTAAFLKLQCKMNNNITERDLMVGDWVYYGDKKQMPCIVKSIIGNNIRFDDGTPQDWMSDVKNFTPVPLTTEILEKNFPTIEDGVTWSDTADSDLFNIRAEYDKYVEGIFKYVHELQHALRLAGIDKELTI